MKTAVIGSGSWGTALAQTLQDNGQDVIVYGVDDREIRDINENHKNSKYFGDIQLNPGLKATTDINAVRDADVVVLAVPSIAIEPIVKEVDAILEKPAVFVNVAKGFHPVTNERLSDVIRHSVRPEHLSSVVSLIGPSHAEEVVIRQLTTIDAVSQNEEDAKLVQNLFSNGYLRIYTGTDEVGSELGAAIKNVMAIASGILSGLGYQDNTRAALITRGLQEMIRYGTNFGGKEQTFMGLTGVGDLIVTCTSMHSRNRRAGILIGQGKTAQQAIAELGGAVVEGYYAAASAKRLADRAGVEMPITQGAYEVLYEGADPRKVLKQLMDRERRDELETEQSWI